MYFRVPYADMLFFDDNMSNIRAARKKGMTSMLVPRGKDWRGLSMEALKVGLRSFGEVEASKGMMMGWLKRVAPSGAGGATTSGDRDGEKQGGGGKDGEQGMLQKRQRNE